MKYREDKYGNEISALDYGCMRFPQTLGKINKEKTGCDMNHHSLSIFISPNNISHIRQASERTCSKSYSIPGILSCLYPSRIWHLPGILR